MGLLKSLCKMFRCKSSCTLNEPAVLERGSVVNLAEFDLSYNDLKKLQSVLMKRQKSVDSFANPNPNHITQI